MQKVVTINLNDNAYQIDESGYAALVAYLEGADRSLKAALALVKYIEKHQDDKPAQKVNLLADALSVAVAGLRCC